jgi:hypothetical protein
MNNRSAWMARQRQHLLRAAEHAGGVGDLGAPHRVGRLVEVPPLADAVLHVSELVTLYNSDLGFGIAG